MLDSTKPNRLPLLLLVAILIVGFLIRFWLLDKRWINPDEGAHLMDGRLILNGFVPMVDYDSREVAYVYIIASIFKIFGVGYITGRFLPLFSTMGIGLMVLLISRNLFNEKVALLAFTIYMFSPLSIVESSIAKTEPLAILFSCIAIYLVIGGIKSRKSSDPVFFLSGVFLSLAYYARRSALAILVAVFFYFAIAYRREIKRFFRNYGIILCGYLFTCLIVFAYYSQFMTVAEIWGTSINPLNIVLSSVEQIFAVLVGDSSTAEISRFESGSQSWGSVFYYLRLTLLTNLPLFVGFLFSIIILAYSLFTKRSNGTHVVAFVPFLLLYSWLSTLTIFYFYWLLRRGFYIQYFEEFLPPLAILLAFVITYFLSKLELKGFERPIIVISILLLLAVFVFHRRFSELNLENVVYSYVLVITMCLLVFAALGLKLKRRFEQVLSFFATFLIFSSFVLSFAVSGHTMSLAFDSVWSPETVKEASNYLRMNSEEGDEVMSGAVIWELEADLKPFMLQSHPLSYKPGISKRKLKEMEQYLSEHPPKFIVLDGYTEQTYLRHIDKLRMLIDDRYELKKIINGSRYPVKIYELKVNSLIKPRTTDLPPPLLGSSPILPVKA